MVTSGTGLSFTNAINLVNPAYNPNVGSYFPQPLPLPVTSLAPERSINSTTNPPHKREGVETLRCEICSINCNSKEMLDNHMSGKKHRKKTKATNPDTSMLDHVKMEHVEGADLKSVKNIGNDPLPGVEKISTASGISCGTQALFHQHVSLETRGLVVEGIDRDTTMLEPSSIWAPNASEMHKPRLRVQECSTSVAKDSFNHSDVHDDITTDKSLPTQLKADYSADSMLCASNDSKVEGILKLVEGSASRTSVLVCTVCNIFSNSQVSLKKHLAGKTHARNVKKFCSVKNFPVSAFPIEVLESNNLKPTRDTHSAVDPSSAVPIESMEIEEEELTHSEGGTAISSANVCTISNIECKTQELLQGHLAGKKHASKVRMLGSDTHTPGCSMSDAASRKSPSVWFHDHYPTVTSHADAKFNDASIITLMDHQDNNHLDKSVVCLSPNATTSAILVTPPKDDNSTGQLNVCTYSNGTDTLQDSESEGIQRASKRGTIVQFVYCDVCGVYCNSSQLLNTHIMGKKHHKQLEKLVKTEKGIKTPEEDITAPRAFASMDYQDGNKSSVSQLSMIVDNQVEAEKGNINSQNLNNMQQGSQDAKISCTLCKVVCNSLMMLSYHLAGRKHAAMLRKTAQSV